MHEECAVIAVSVAAEADRNAAEGAEPVERLAAVAARNELAAGN